MHFKYFVDNPSGAMNLVLVRRLAEPFSLKLAPTELSRNMLGVQVYLLSYIVHDCH